MRLRPELLRNLSSPLKPSLPLLISPVQVLWLPIILVLDIGPKSIPAWLHPGVKIAPEASKKVRWGPHLRGGPRLELTSLGPMERE